MAADRRRLEARIERGVARHLRFGVADDGALLLVAKDDRAVRIEVGYGIEGALNDATAARIIAEVITPRFRQGDFYGGLTAGLDRIVRVLDGEALPAPTRRGSASSDNGLGQSWPVLFIVALVLGGVLRQVLGRVPGAFVVGGVLGVVAWFALGTLAVAAAFGRIADLSKLPG